METRMDACRRLPVLAAGNEGRSDHVEFPVAANSAVALLGLLDSDLRPLRIPSLPTGSQKKDVLVSFRALSSMLFGFAHIAVSCIRAPRDWDRMVNLGNTPIRNRPVCRRGPRIRLTRRGEKGYLTDR